MIGLLEEEVSQFRDRLEFKGFSLAAEDSRPCKTLSCFSNKFMISLEKLCNRLKMKGGIP
jgi:hypothetical protein